MRQKAVRANGLATQERALAAAEELFATHGYEATSLRQIATAAGIDIATLKYHFKDKPSLFGEVYRSGHIRFVESIEPMLGDLDRVESQEDMAVLIDDFVTAVHDFIDANLPFVRLTLFRILEDSQEVISLEEELQAVTISRVDGKFQKLLERGIIREIDTRALVVFLMATFSMWNVTARVKPNWLGSPGLNTKAGRARSEKFFIDLLANYLI